MDIFFNLEGSSKILKDAKNLNFEKGKAIIQLAYLVMIFSGFMLALGGVSYTNLINNIFYSSNLISQSFFNLISFNYSDISEDKVNLLKNSLELNKGLLGIAKPQITLMNTFLYFGIFGSIFSFIIWTLGYYFIYKS